MSKPRKPPLTAEQRHLRAKLAAQARWAREDPKPQTQEASAAFLQRFLDDIDPSLPQEERERRAAAARRAYFTQLAYRSSRVRQAKAAARRSSQGSR